MKKTTKVLSTQEENDILAQCFYIAHKAGKKLIQSQKKISKLKVTYKEAQGVASSADLESEKSIVTHLRRCYPHHEFMAEEAFFKSKKLQDDSWRYYQEQPWCWAIDPLDGTHNYLNGHSYFAICLCLMHFGRPVVAVVYRPSSGECFYATSSSESKKINLLNKSKATSLLKLKNNKKLKESLLVTGFATEKGKVFDREFEIFKDMMSKCRGVRRFGSAALDICYVAQGILDAFWERGLSPWDVAASGLIAQQAKVKVTDYESREFNPFCSTIAMARMPLYREFIRQF